MHPQAALPAPPTPTAMPTTPAVPRLDVELGVLVPAGSLLVVVMVVHETMAVEAPTIWEPSWEHWLESFTLAVDSWVSWTCEWKRRGQVGETVLVNNGCLRTWAGESGGQDNV